MNDIKLNKDFLVTVHNDLVQARFSDSLTINEQKILFAVLSNIEPPEFELNEKGERIIKNPIKEIEPFRIPIKEFSGWLGFKDPNYIFFKNTVKKLMRKLIEIKQDNGSWEAFQWVTKSSYIATEGLAEIKLSPELYPYILNLEKNFTTIRLSVLLNFKSVYSTRLYQLIKKWAQIGSYKVEVEELKHLLGVPIVKEVNGKNQFKLALYGHFKSRALEIALKEINEHSEFHVEMIEHKTGRKVTSLSFLIRNKEKPKKAPEKPSETPPASPNGIPEDNTSNSSEGVELYGKTFLETYKENNRKYYSRKTNEPMLFDGKERVKAIILNNKYSDFGSDACYAIEEQLMKIINVAPGIKLSRIISELFSYTRGADTINNPEAFIISSVKKIVETIKKGNTDIALENILNMKKQVRFERLPDYYFDGERSKSEVERKQNIKFELTRLRNSNITLSDVRYFKLMLSLDKEEFDTEDWKVKYSEYKSLVELGLLDKLVEEKKDELTQLGYLDKTGDLREELIESIYLSELKRSA